MPSPECGYNKVQFGSISQNVVQFLITISNRATLKISANVFCMTYCGEKSLIYMYIPW